jgi:hypothetical protein
MIYNITKYQKAGLKLLLNHIKRNHPFIIDLIPIYRYFETHGTHLYFDLKFDLEVFYETTGAYPPKHYEDSPYLYELLKNPGSYLMRYTDNDLNERFGLEYNKIVEKELNSFYKHLPEYMRLSKFEGFEESDFNYRHGLALDFYIKWQAAKEALDVGINEWVPVFDLSKYYIKEN